MNNVTRFPGTAREETAKQLTSGHLFLMYAILDLTVRISLETGHKAGVDYCGTVHTLTVDVIPPEHLATDVGGDQSWATCYRAYIYLPPHPLAEGDTLQQLGDIITALEQYLPTQGGAA